MRKKNLYCGSGFTVVEMLTTVAIIAILIGLLIPALNMVKEAALNVKQRAQFNGIEFALEAFRAEPVFGDYPPSNENRPVSVPTHTVPDGAMVISRTLLVIPASSLYPVHFP